MLLEVKDLVVKYGEITAISGISLEAEEGQLTTLIGSNGAGKSDVYKRQTLYFKLYFLLDPQEAYNITLPDMPV